MRTLRSRARRPPRRPRSPAALDRRHVDRRGGDPCDRRARERGSPPADREARARLDERGSGPSGSASAALARGRRKRANPRLPTRPARRPHPPPAADVAEASAVRRRAGTDLPPAGSARRRPERGRRRIAPASWLPPRPSRSWSPWSRSRGELIAGGPLAGGDRKTTFGGGGALRRRALERSEGAARPERAGSDRRGDRGGAGTRGDNSDGALEEALTEQPLPVVTEQTPTVSPERCPASS